MKSPITDLLDYHISARHTPGALVHVEQAGRTLARHAAGQARPDAAALLDWPQRFRIASLTKPVVSFAALMLADEGRLDLDAAIGEYLPALRDMRLKGGAKPAAAPSVRDLMRHTSGLAYPYELADAELRAAWANAGLSPGSAGQDSAAFLRSLAALPLVAEPGTAFRYGYSTDVLGCIVEKLVDETLGAALQRRLFAPLGMRHTGFEIAADELAHMASACQAASSVASGSCRRSCSPRWRATSCPQAWTARPVIAARASASAWVSRCATTGARRRCRARRAS